MALLKTLEGPGQTSTGDNLDDLFYTNDVLGCLIYGPEGWNQVKRHACNVALSVLAERAGTAAAVRKITGRKNYQVTNDILDKVFGFNHARGVELLGAEDWNELVLECKSYSPYEEAPEVMGGFLDSVGRAAKSLLNPVGTVVPSNMSAAGIAQWIVAPGLTNVSDAFAAVGVKTEAQKKAEQQAAQQAQARAAAEQAAYMAQVHAAQQVQAAQDVYSQEKARAAAAAEAEAQANANLKYMLQTSPEYQQGQTNKIMIIGGFVLLAVTLLTRERK